MWGPWLTHNVLVLIIWILDLQWGWPCHWPMLVGKNCRPMSCLRPSVILLGRDSKWNWSLLLCCFQLIQYLQEPYFCYSLVPGWKSFHLWNQTEHKVLCSTVLHLRSSHGLQEFVVYDAVGASAPVPSFAAATGCPGLLGGSGGRWSCNGLLLLCLLFLLFLRLVPWLRALQIAYGARSKTIVTINEVIVK